MKYKMYTVTAHDNVRMTPRERKEAEPEVFGIIIEDIDRYIRIKHGDINTDEMSDAELDKFYNDVLDEIFADLDKGKVYDAGDVDIKLIKEV